MHCRWQGSCLRHLCACIVFVTGSVGPAQGAIAGGCSNAPCGPNASCTELVTSTATSAGSTTSPSNTTSSSLHHTCDCLPGFANTTNGCEPIDACAEPCIAHQVQQGFDSAANAISGWLRDGLPFSTVTTCGDSQILGGFGEAVAGTVLSRSFSALPAHAKLSLKLTVFAIDLWQNGDLVLLVDGVQVAALAGINTTANGADQCGLPGPDPGLYELSAQAPHSAGSLTVELRATPNQGLGVQSWGLADFQLELRRAEPCHSCSPNAACSSDASGPSCTCHLGFVGNGSSCEDAAACLARCNGHPCDASGACRCGEPFYDNGTSCVLNACASDYEITFGPYDEFYDWNLGFVSVWDAVACPAAHLLGPFKPGDVVTASYQVLPNMHTRLRIVITFSVSGSWHGEQLTLYEAGTRVALSDPIHVLPNVMEPCGQTINGSTLLTVETSLYAHTSTYTDLALQMSSLSASSANSTWGIASARFLMDGDDGKCAGLDEQCAGTDAVTCSCLPGFAGDPCADVDECAAPACSRHEIVETFAADQLATGWPISTVSSNCTQLPPHLGGAGVLTNQTMSKLFTGIPAHSSVSVELQLVMLDAWAATLGSPDLIQILVDGVLSGQTPTPISSHTRGRFCGDYEAWVPGPVLVTLPEMPHTAGTLELSLAPQLMNPNASWGIADVTITLDPSSNLGCNECTKPHMTCINYPRSPRFRPHGSGDIYRDSNHMGNYGCGCMAGYHLFGGRCVDIDECNYQVLKNDFSEGEETGWFDIAHGNRPLQATAACQGTPMLRESGEPGKFWKPQRTFRNLPGHSGVKVYVILYIADLQDYGTIKLDVDGYTEYLWTLPSPWDSTPGCGGPHPDVGLMSMSVELSGHTADSLTITLSAAVPTSGGSFHSSFGIVSTTMTLKKHECLVGETCTNTEGSYNCTCDPGKVYTSYRDWEYCIDGTCPACNGSEHNGFNLTGCAEGHAEESPTCFVGCATGFGGIGQFTCIPHGVWLPSYPLCIDYEPTLNATAGAPYTGPPVGLNVHPASPGRLLATVSATNLDPDDTLTVSNDPADFGSITALFSPRVDRTGRPPIRVQLNVSHTSGLDEIRAVEVPEFELELSAPLATSVSTQFGFAGQSYLGQKPKIVGGKPPYSFALSGGTLPAGLRVNRQGTITGTPSQVGSFPDVVVQVTDANGASISLEPVNLQIISALEVTTGVQGLLPTAVAGVEYFQEFNFTTVGGTGATTFEALGNVPASLAVDPESGALFGIPLSSSARAEPYLFEIVASDDSGIEVTALGVSLVVEARPDCDDPGNGPNGQGCGTGVCVDLVAFDGVFACDCSATGLGGDNCHLVDTGEVTVANSRAGMSPAVTGSLGALAALVLILMVIALLVRRAQIRARNKPFDFQAELERMRDEGLIVLHGGEEEAGLPREIRRGNIQLLDKLGAGQFGDVFKGTVDESAATGIPAYLVAVKTLKGDPSSQEMTELMREAALMAQFRHPNVVNIVGVCTKGEPYYLVAQFCEHGALVDYLKAQPLPLEETPMMTMAHEIATGMEYLAGAGLVHRDLAARNVLLDSHLVCKVADFGMSRDVKTSDKDYYRAGHGGMLPVRWAAPEALDDQVFSQQSDVWAWGITVYEILTCGALPYDGWSNEKVWVSVKGGFRLACPKGVTPKLFQEIVEPCWLEDPRLRPTFSTLCKALQSRFPSLHARVSETSENHYMPATPPPARSATNAADAPPQAYFAVQCPDGDNATTGSMAPAGTLPAHYAVSRTAQDSESRAQPPAPSGGRAVEVSYAAIDQAMGPAATPLSASVLAPQSLSYPDYGESPCGFQYACIDGEGFPGKDTGGPTYSDAEQVNAYLTLAPSADRTAGGPTWL